MEKEHPIDAATDRILSTTAAWWPMPGCSFRPPWRGTSACPNVRQRLDLGDAPGRANTSDKMMTLVASALAGGDCIDDADVLRTGGTASTLGGTVKAAIHPGHLPGSFRWGHVRQLDRVSRELLARAWQAGAGPGDGPLTIDLDSTICTDWPRRASRHHGYGYHPLFVAAGTGDVLMARLREGRANTARGAVLRETVSRVRYGGASGQLTMRADSGFYTHAVVAVCRRINVRYSITIRQHKSLHNLIEAIPGCLDADSLLDGRCRRCGRDHLHPLPGRGRRRAGTAHRPAGEADANAVPNWPSSPNTAITASSPTGTGSCSNWRLTIAATPRSRMPYATSSTASG